MLRLCAVTLYFLEKPLGPPFAPLSFKKIILDPPCSGLGQRPQLRYIASDQEIQSYPRYQRKLIEQVSNFIIFPAMGRFWSRSFIISLVENIARVSENGKWLKSENMIASRLWIWFTKYFLVFCLGFSEQQRFFRLAIVFYYSKYYFYLYQSFLHFFDVKKALCMLGRGFRPKATIFRWISGKYDIMQ